MHNILQFSPQLTALEFFSGIGLARAGMAKAGIKTIWANDIDRTKCAMYSQCWGDEHLVEQDVHTLDPDLIPQADIAWASSLAQTYLSRETGRDLSLAKSPVRSLALLRPSKE